MSKRYDAEKIGRLFKAYDVRGKCPQDLDEDFAYGIGQAYATFVKPKKVCVGHDARRASPSLRNALVEGLRHAGCDVLDLGLCGTEQVYFATFHLELDGGIMVTASHNPTDDNGMKFVREKAKPISGDTGLQDMAKLMREGELVGKKWITGKCTQRSIQNDYFEHLLGLIDRENLRPLKIVFNCCHGSAGSTLKGLLANLPFQAVHLLDEPNDHFPYGPPNPLLENLQKMTSEVILREKADLGVAFDGDFDRCFFFDEKGHFIDGYYLVGLLATRFLERFPGERIVHDPRLFWDTVEVIEKNSGIAVQHKSGHAFMKERMRVENAAFGGETSAHYYFREFGYCDSGMLPMLVVTEILSKTGKKMSELIGARMERFPVSGEINRKVSDADAVMASIRKVYEVSAKRVDETDGLGFDFDDWRFNIRKSNTEALIRLNVEARGDRRLVAEKTAEVLQFVS